jgi:hypothetical protein
LGLRRTTNGRRATPMPLAHQLHTQLDQLNAAIATFQQRLTELPTEGSAHTLTAAALEQARAEHTARAQFLHQVEAALAACQAYRQQATRAGFQQLLHHYRTLLVQQPDPLARLYLNPHAAPAVISGCRACAATLLRGLEKALGSVNSEQ